MSSETTPLLADDNVQPQTKDVYDRFSLVQKRVILTVISLAGLIAPFASGCFVPCVPEIAKDLNTSGTVINYTVGVYILAMSMGSLIWAPYAGFYGRQPVYMVSLPILCAGSLGAAMSVNVAQLVVSRTLQAFGASCVMSVGAATVSDVYRLEERGTAMGIFFGAILLGPALAPLIGGITATYASWRVMQLILFTMGLAAFISIATYLPETSHPGTRGIDKLQQEPTGPGDNPEAKRRRFRWVWLNPFKSVFELLRGPNVFLVALACSFVLMTFFVLMVPLSYTLGPRYGINSPALVGLCFFPSGIGNIVGATVGGRLADRAVVRGLKRRGGKWVPEDRLTATLPGALVLVPLSVLIFGLTTEFVPGTLGLVINLLCLFMNGLGLDIVLAPAATYNVDILRHRSAEAMAVNSASRNVLCAIASAGVLPAINACGVGATNGLVAVIAWFAFGILWGTIRYGDRLRAWVDIGYTSTLTNS